MTRVALVFALSVPLLVPACASPPAPASVPRPEPAVTAVTGVVADASAPADVAVEAGLDGAMDSQVPPRISPARSPTIREGGASMNGRLPPEVVQRVVREHLPAIRECYERGLEKNEHLAGRVGVLFTIDGRGNVSFAADAGSDLPDADAVTCIVGVFRSLQFPAPAGGTVSVSYPLVFTVE
jgi:hypothetical protein